MRNNINKYLLLICLALPISVSSQYFKGTIDCESRGWHDYKLGDLNNDNILDSLSITYNVSYTNNISASVYFLGKSDYIYIDDILITPIGGCLSSPDFIIKNGDLIYEENDYESNVLNQYRCKYKPELKRWYIYSTIRLKKGDISHDQLKKCKEILLGPYSTLLGDKYPPEIVTVVSKDLQKQTLEELKRTHKICLSEFRSDNNSKAYNLESKELIEYLETVPINDSTVYLFNDLAFFVIESKIRSQQVSENIYTAITILENILYRYPKRTVAYINLGDAYWGLEEKDNARQAYQKYIELMKANGKESKIQKRIFDRMK